MNVSLPQPAVSLSEYTCGIDEKIKYVLVKDAIMTQRLTNLDVKLCSFGRWMKSS